MTPAEVNHTIKGVQRDRRRWALTTAWNTAWLPHQKKIKTLAALIADDRVQPATIPQTGDQIFGNLMTFLGVKRKKGKPDG